MATSPARIAGQIWHDRNGNGLRDSTDTPYGDSFLVRLDRLDAASGDWLAEQVFSTAADGRYGFDGLIGGVTYRVAVNQPGYVSGPVLPGGNQFGPGDTGDERVSSPLVLADGESRNGLDAGLYTPPLLQGRVWQDLNGDGQQQATEPGLAGVRVQLLTSDGGLAAVDITDDSGAYGFGQSAPGSYRVAVEAPSGTRFTRANVGPDASDSDVDTATGQTSLITLAPDQQLAGVDAGLLGQATSLTTLGGRVWQDSNGNGLQDTGDAGFAGVRLDLLALTGAIQASTVSDALGAYSFKVLPGSYQVLAYVTTAGWQPTLTQQGGDPTRDSDLLANSSAGPITLVAGSPQTHLDLGLVRPITLGDRVWNDLNRNGQQDAGEPGVPGVPVRLLDGQGEVLQATTTDASGLYHFDALAPGAYELAFQRPADMAWTTPGAAGGSVVDPGTGRTGVHVLLSGSDLLLADAGLVALRAGELAHIGDWVFDDRNGNGVQDSGDVGLAQAEVRLLDAQGNWLTTARTDASGHWGMDVAPGSYQLQVVTGTAHRATLSFQGQDLALDSNIDARGLSPVFTVQAGQRDTTLDAGGYLPARLGGLAWRDSNGNGQREPAETGLLPGVAVTLLNDHGLVVARSSTDGQGAYLFDTLAPGQYSVRFAAPRGLQLTLANAGPDGQDSDADPASGQTAAYTLLSGARALDVDAGWVPGLVTPATVTGRVFHDRNHDGLQDAGDTSLRGGLVQLLDAQGRVLDAVYSGADGVYSFSTGPGSYALQVSGSADWAATLAHQGSDRSLDSDIDAAGRVALFSLAPGQVLAHVDMGAYHPALAGLLSADGALDQLLAGLPAAPTATSLAVAAAPNVASDAAATGWADSGLATAAWWPLQLSADGLAGTSA